MKIEPEERKKKPERGGDLYEGDLLSEYWKRVREENEKKSAKKAAD